MGILENLLLKGFDVYTGSTIQSAKKTLKQAGKWCYTDLGKKLNGKKLGILGLPGSGKTTLANYFANNHLGAFFDDVISPKLFVGDYEGRTLKDLWMKINIVNIKSNDGKPYHKKYDYSQEIDILRTSDIILYLFDITKLFSATEKDRYFKTIRKEIEVYSQSLDSSQEKILIP